MSARHGPDEITRKKRHQSCKTKSVNISVRTVSSLVVNQSHRPELFDEVRDATPASCPPFRYRDASPTRSVSAWPETSSRAKPSSKVHAALDAVPGPGRVGRGAQKIVGRLCFGV